jgi:hypothetical protein
MRTPQIKTSRRFQMVRRILTAMVVGVLLGVVSVNAQQSPDLSSLTRYESFLKRADAVIVTQSHPVADLPGGGGFKIAAKVAWGLGEPNKVYAADISGRIVDFDQLKGIQDGLDKLAQAINNSYEKLNAASMGYASSAGLTVNYYSYTTDNSGTKKTLYVAVGSYVLQSPKLESLLELRDQIARTREKLISLGAR